MHANQARDNLSAIIGGLVLGSLSSMLIGTMVVLALGGSKQLALSMLPKAVTTPIAISISGQIGGVPALTAALAITGGVVAAVTLQLVQRVLRVTECLAVGLAAGTAGSGVGAAQVIRLGDVPTAFAAIGISMNGLLTALIAPIIARFVT